MQRTIAVRELPPRLVLRILVRGELRKGMCSCLPSAYMAMTCVKKNRLLLMYWPSLIRRFAEALGLVVPPELIFDVLRWVVPKGLGLRIVAPIGTLAFWLVS